MSKNKSWVYDIETYSNFFCAVFRHNSEYKVFEISERKNDYEKLCKFYKNNVIKYAIGFNNINFDSQVLHWITSSNKNDFGNLNNIEICEMIFDFAQEVIESKNENGKPLPKIPHKSIKVPQIDLYRINHYDNVNKATSLKWVEFSLNHPRVQDLPYSITHRVKIDEIDIIIDYCKNDVDATYKFMLYCKDLIKLRIQQDLENEGLGLLNKPDSSVGESIFLKRMSEAMSVDPKVLREMRTYRDVIKVKDILLPYINFKTDEFKGLLEFYKKATQGGISKTVRYKDLDYVFGEGGLHASWNDRIFESDDNYIIIDLDVSSYYPNLFIQNDWRPEHLGEKFSEVYNDIYQERKTHPKGSVGNQSLKIVLNGSYGKTGDSYSFLYDPQVMLQICVNGQLLLAMLAERLSLIDGVTIVQCNTDGVTIHAPRSKQDDVRKITEKWQKLTKLELEEAIYKKMIISNVNNYIAVYENGKIKDKGASYIIDSEPHKNPSQRIVRIALRRYLVYGIPIKETIENHLHRKDDYEDGVKNNGIYDFCIGKKVKYNQNFVIVKGMNEEPIKQKVIRYYISNNAGIMLKKYNDGRAEHVNRGYKTKLFMDYYQSDDYNVNYNYYINEAYKITTPFDNGNPKLGKQLSLFD